MSKSVKIYTNENLVMNLRRGMNSYEKHTRYTRMTIDDATLLILTLGTCQYVDNNSQ